MTTYIGTRENHNRENNRHTTDKKAATLSPPIFTQLAARNATLSPQTGKAVIPDNKAPPPPRARQGRPTRPRDATSLSPKFDKFLASVDPTNGNPQKHKKPDDPILASLCPAVDTKESHQLIFQTTIQEDDAIQELINSDGNTLASFAKNTEGNTFQTWTLRNGTGEEIAYIKELHSSKSETRQEPVSPKQKLKQRSYRLYGKHPLYPKQEKSRIRPETKGGPVHVLYHWADFKKRTSGLFGRSTSCIMTLHVPHQPKHHFGPYRIVEPKPLSPLRTSEDEPPKRTIIMNTGNNTTSAMLEHDGSSSNKSLSVEPNTDPLLIATFLLAMGRLE